MSNAEMKVTEVSALTNQQWQARKQDAVAIGQGNIAPVYVERALGSELWDVE
ncbi:MAG: 4-aminobutyrate--2-oxoglutarate transaminase, partial [Gammaproteobacteria bacterium]|nr:4-aminobutyrate--2-oxoglutarate transaminase [Gammaproteobacteria bacterium]